jgi:excisionase family DNA binding protein
MIRFTTQNGLLEFEDREATLELLKHQQEIEAREKAQAAELSRAYTVPELAARLRMSERSAYDLIRGGAIAYFCVGGQKGYRVSEEAVRDFQRQRGTLAQAA